MKFAKNGNQSEELVSINTRQTCIDDKMVTPCNCEIGFQKLNLSYFLCLYLQNKFRNK